MLVEKIKDYYKAGVDIGGTKITASLSNRDGILVKVFQPTKLEGDNTTLPEQVDFLIGYICDKIGIKKEEIDGVGVSTASPFERRGNYQVIVSPNLCGGLSDRKFIRNDWTWIPAEEELSKIYNSVKIENDCVSAVVSERLFGAGKGENNLVYVTWSTGIGSGAYVDGKLIKGKNGNAPHLGHSYIAEDGPQCGCGNFGDLESLTSGIAIARDYGNGATTEEVFSAYNKGDSKAIGVIERASKNFARGLASINTILDTKVFVIGGSVFMNNKEVLLPLIEKEIYKSFPVFSKGVEIKPSALDKYLGDIAALSLVMPDDLVKNWQDKKPWEHAPKSIILDEEGKELNQ